MRFVRCGSKMFDPKAVTAVFLAQDGEGVKVLIPGHVLCFCDEEARAVRAYFLSIHATDLLRRDEDEAPELPPLVGSQWPPVAEAVNHIEGEC